MARSRPRRGSAASRPARAGVIPTAVIPSVMPSPLPPRTVQRALRALVDAGAAVRPAGLARTDPTRLMRGRYAPTSLIELFDTRLFLTDYFQTPELRFFVAYVVQECGGARTPEIFPRIFYKDGSLVWRAGSHMVSSADEFWVGKGDIRTVVKGGYEYDESVESTTDLPFEIQTALEIVSRKTVHVRSEKLALDLVLQNAPPSRLRAFADFTTPRRRAAADRRNLIHGGRSVARFRRRHDPASLVIAPGYEPDFRRGILERATSTSVLYGGALERFRIVSTNRKIQYQFFAGPHQVWIIPPQATTTELSSFGVRTIDVVVDEDMCCPGYEYHFMDDSVTPPVLHSQIPPGFAGPPGPHDPDRSDAAPWLDKLPIIRRFRRQVLERPDTRTAC